MKHSSSGIRGFSLIELMVVVLIIGIIAGFVGPSVTTILRGSQMNQASQILADQVNLARQYALSRNHPVEVRLIRFADPEMPGEVQGGTSTPSNGAYRAIQIMETLDAVDPTTGDFVRLPLDKPQLLPQAIVMNKGALSTILSEATPGTSPGQITPMALTNDPPLPRNVGKNYDYVWFRFLPDGSTNLPAHSNTDANGAWFITLQNITDPPTAIKPPPNFFALQIDPISGTIKQFRPGLSAHP